MGMEKYTLISVIGKGTGKATDSGGYVQTKYRFPDGAEYSEPLLSKAILKYFSGKIKQLVILGTTTSNWYALLSTTDNLELCCTAHDEVNNGGIQEKTIKEIKDALASEYKCNVELLSHHESLISDNLPYIWNVYDLITEKIEKNTKLIIDITYGLRYMPMMIFQSLQALNFSPDDVILYYGEYSNESSVSHVRDISSLWKYAQLSKMVYSFENSFDGMNLVPYLEANGYKYLGKFIKDFSDMVAKNYVLQIREAIIEMNDVIKKTVIIEDTPLFIKKLYLYLKKLCSKFSMCKTDSDYLLVFAEILNRKNMKTQAIISLRECLATSLIQKYDKNLKKGEYVDLSKKDYFQAFLSNLRNVDLFKPINRIFTLRNKIAHAGTDDMASKPKYEDFDFENLYGCAKKALKYV